MEVYGNLTFPSNFAENFWGDVVIVPNISFFHDRVTNASNFQSMTAHLDMERSVQFFQTICACIVIHQLAPLTGFDIVCKVSSFQIYFLLQLCSALLNDPATFYSVMNVDGIRSFRLHVDFSEVEVGT